MEIEEGGEMERGEMVRGEMEIVGGEAERLGSPSPLLAKEPWSVQPPSFELNYSSSPSLPLAKEPWSVQPPSFDLSYSMLDPHLQII